MAGLQKIGETLQLVPGISRNLSSGLSNKDYVCPKCLEKVKSIEVEILGKIKLIRVPCICEVRQREEEEQERQLQEKKRRIEKLFSFAQLGPKFGKTVFESWEQTSGTYTAYKEALNFVKEKRWEKGEGLLFFGAPGTGKSHLAAAIVNEVIPQGVVAVFQNVPELLLRFKNSYNSNSAVSEWSILRIIEEADLVVLDDLGAEYLTEWALEKIYEVVNSLNYFEKSLIVTTNLNMEVELEKRVGNRIYDRLIEMCRLIEVKGESFRKIKATRRIAELKQVNGQP